MNTTSATKLRTFLLLLLAAILTSAEEFDECDSKSNCEDCLTVGFCDWYGSDWCSHNNARIADIQMYSLDFTTESVQEVCQRAATDSADDNLCASLTDCASCVEGVLSDGSSCKWFADIGFCNAGCNMLGCGGVLSDGSSCKWFADIGFCNAGCNMLGCGETTCSAVSAPVIGGGITGSLPGDSGITAPPPPLSGVDTDEIMCKSKTDSASCASTVPFDPNSTCVWVTDVGRCETTEVITEFSAAGSFGYKSSILLVVGVVISVLVL
eukprot:CAMPEP_0197284068 /NCGR_PEP_ID=MMETSP1432-20130617/25252_1 /TAXON_ID=44447 /ORGANISM="Pseudo-nitzschia delicatissima, Strain UNC1205" /LENGTH=266 /DNA_ID=CAMNT_0042751067 /DNA_START=138 /DNA_END=938 /DNA_ORIENTATION=-